MPSLQIESGKHKGKRIRIPADGCTIGRGEEAGLRIASGEISRLHCRVSPDGDGFTVEDLESANGTFVNGSPIDRPTEVAAGDQIVIGPVTFSVTGGTAAPTKARRKPKPPNVKAGKSAQKLSDDEISSWLTEEVPDKADASEDTHVLRREGVTMPTKAKPERRFDNVAEEAEDIIRRHRESLGQA